MNQHRSVGILNDGDCWHHHSRCLIAEMIWTATFGSRIGSSYWTLLLILGILWREPRTTGSHAPPKTGSGVRDHDLLRIIKLRHGSIVRSVAEYGTFALFNRFCFNDRHCREICKSLWLASFPFTINNTEVHLCRCADMLVPITWDFNKQQVWLAFIFIYCCFHLPYLLSFRCLFCENHL